MKKVYCKMNIVQKEVEKLIKYVGSIETLPKLVIRITYKCP